MTRKTHLIALSTSAVIALSCTLIYREELLALVARASAWVDSMGAMAPVLYVVIFAVAVPLFVPTSPLLLAAGMLFNVWPGLLLGYIGNTLGGFLAFALGRSKLQHTVRKFLRSNETFTAMDKAIADGGVKTATLIRMSPLLPGPVLNYALGVTRLSRRDYLIASVGTLPLVLAFTLLGSTLSQFAQLNDSQTLSELSDKTLPVMAVGVIATIIAAKILANRATKLLNSTAETRPPSSPKPLEKNGNRDVLQ